MTPDNEPELANAMVQATSDESTRRQRGRNARRLIERRYDWRRVAQDFDRIYSDLLA